ncbi:MAG TPA: thioredoxin domain-containing protein, partial [Rhodospirillales bacterium]
MSHNVLTRETSPYLLQHKDNPVHWHPWGPEALAEAKAENKPILLSVGYAACHWCHVMAHESFEDPDTAALMNRGFVNIKVDREERPDLDVIYQAALALIGEQGGWPLTMFLTPGGEPFWGGTYFPPEPRFGRPGFRDLLSKVLEVYRSSPDKVAANAASLKSALQSLSRPRAGGAVPPEFLGRAATALMPAVDPVNGGIGQAPKFPQPALLELVWRGFKQTQNRELSQAVMLTLERMSLGGIYDHLGGGYARYSTDPEWLVPHFEKMLYDNAQLIALMTLAWPETKSPLLAARVAETVDWALRDMRVAGGGFASSYDADSEGHEGRFYVWPHDEIDRVLGPDAGAFKSAYDVTEDGNWEGTNILRRMIPYPAAPALEEKLAKCRADLWRAREARVKPGW